MAISENFKRIAARVRQYVGDTYDLLNLTSELEDIVNEEIARVTSQVSKDRNLYRDQLFAANNVQARTSEALQNVLSAWVVNDSGILQLLVDGKKIQAIKELRTMFGGGLRDTKLAVEASNVREAVDLIKNPLADWERELLTGVEVLRNSKGETVTLTNPYGDCGDRDCEACYTPTF